MLCPLCQSGSELIFEIKGYSIRDCCNCSHRFAEIVVDESHVDKVYDDSYFNGGNAGYANYLLDAEILRKRGRMYAEKLQKFMNPGRVLDVGAAAGFILQGFVDMGWNGVGLEPNASMAQAGYETLGLDIRKGSLESFQTTEKFDLISMIQVIAHFYEPRTAFDRASELLKDNGYLLIETWNQGSFSARIFGKNWHEYSPPSVLHWFSKDRLTAFLDGFGFKQVAHGRLLKKISGMHAKSLLKYRLGDSYILKMIPDKIVFPYPSEDLFWALYKKSSKE